MIAELRSATGKVEFAGILGLAAGLTGSFQWIWATGILGLAALGVWGWGFWQQRHQKSDLAEGIQQTLEITSGSIDRVLKAVGYRLNISTEQNLWRISLYEQLIPSGDWKRIGRACPDESYAHGGRETFGRLEGILRDALSGSDRPEGRTEISPVLPDRKQEADKWLTLQEGFGLHSDSVAALRFPARHYFARVCKIDDGNGHGTAYALIAECSQPNALTKNHLEAMVPTSLFEALASAKKTREAFEELRDLVD